MPYDTIAFMFVARATMGLRNALGRVGVQMATDPQPSTTMLGDWYATLVRMGRGTYVLAVAERTLLPIVVSGRELKTFPARMIDTLGSLLEELGVRPEAVAHERAEMSDVRFERTNDRSTVGVLVNLEHSLRVALDQRPGWDLLEASRWLAETPIVARDLFPDLATCELFGAPRPVRRSRI